MILVTGAAGKTGRAVIRALAARRVGVHAFVHRAEHVAAMQAVGATAVSVGALDDADAIARAADGTRAVYHICPNVSPLELAYGRAVVAGMARAGLRRLVFHSVLHPQIEAMPHHWQKMRVEEMLFASDLDVTVLQPTAYMQNILASWPTIAASGILRVPYPAATRISLVDLDDVGDVAARVLTDDRHIGATYELAATAPLSQTAVAQVLEQALRRPVRVETETLAAWDGRARAAGMADYQREALLKMFRYYQQHGLVGAPLVLRSLIGREPTSLFDFAEREAKRA